jgi:hypothetical protein
MFCHFNFPSRSGMASPEGDEPFWGWYPDYVQTQLEEQLQGITNPFSESSLEELTNDLHQLLQTHRLNQQVPLLFDNVSLLTSDELQEYSRELAIDPAYHFLLDLELAYGSPDPPDPFGDQLTFDDLLTMATPINQQQDSLIRWLEYAMPSTPTLTPLRSPEPIFDANFSSFLLSPTLSDTEDSESTTSEDCKLEMSSESSFKYEADQSGHANHSKAHAPASYFDQPTYVHCHSHDGVFHGERNCACNCGSPCDFLRRNSKRYKCDCDCPCHTCFQPHNHTLSEDPPRRNSLDGHFETLDLAECGAVFNRPESSTSYHTAPEAQDLESHYLDGIV